MTPTLLACLSLFDNSIGLHHFRRLLTTPTEPLCDLLKDPLHESSVEFLKPHFLEPSQIPLRQARRVIGWCQSEGVKIFYPGHPSYPTAFYSLSQPPLFLSCLGASSWMSAECLAVVGSRDPSSKALEWMDLHFQDFLRAKRVVTVSGGARGIDQKAHGLSVQQGLPTVVFLPSGLGKLYPKDLRGWRKDILGGGGAFLSEFAPHVEMHSGFFEKRNRMIAALGKLLFVVEARKRSGSTMTARLAREVGRDICVLPSSPLSVNARGTLDLLFDGAFPVRDSQDLISLFDLAHVGSLEGRVL